MKKIPMHCSCESQSDTGQTDNNFGYGDSQCTTYSLPHCLIYPKTLMHPVANNLTSYIVLDNVSNSLSIVCVKSGH